MVRAEHDKSRLLAEELLRVARRTGDPRQLLRALHAMGGTSYYRGEFCEAREHLEEFLGLYDPKKHRGHEYLSASANVGVWGLYYFSWTLFSLGYPDQALTRALEALALARELSHPFSEAAALFCLGLVHLERGESKACLETAEALIALSSEQGFRVLAGMGSLASRRGTRRRGRSAGGNRRNALGFRGYASQGRSGGIVVVSLPTLAGAHGKAGQVEEGLAVVAEALEFVTKTGERMRRQSCIV